MSEELNTFILELELLSKIILLSPPIDTETHRILGQRLYLLERIILPQISYDLASVAETKEKLLRLHKTRPLFIISVLDSFAENNINFVNHLKHLGLTKTEINYCCLLTLGFKGKEIGLFTNNPNHYNNSSSIRRKLGLNKNDTNLGNYLRFLFRKNEH